VNLKTGLAERQPPALSRNYQKLTRYLTQSNWLSQCGFDSAGQEVHRAQHPAKGQSHADRAGQGEGKRPRGDKGAARETAEAKAARPATGDREPPPPEGLAQNNRRAEPSGKKKTFLPLQGKKGFFCYA